MCLGSGLVLELGLLKVNVQLSLGLQLEFCRIITIRIMVMLLYGFRSGVCCSGDG